VFLRLMAPPHGFVVRRPPRRGRGRRPLVELGADDRHATTFECRIDHREPYNCPGGRPFQLIKLRPGRHLLLARAGGPGMEYDPAAIRMRFQITR
jgi:hypothetical protein